jgi:DNA-binding CsgD family transcriptional regulator
MHHDSKKTADDDILAFVLNEMPVGVMVFDDKLNTVAVNRAAEKFCRRKELPEKAHELMMNMFDAMRTSRMQELFPGEVYLTTRPEKSPNSWTFKFTYRETPVPLIIIFITEETLANRLDLNRIRRDKRMTRRETDILRRVINGLKNGEIAEDLEVSEQTIKDHLSNIYAKFGVKNRFSLLSMLMETAVLKRHLD